MWGSVNAPGVSGFELREAVGALTGAVMQGAVETPLTTSAGEPLCGSGGMPLTARQTLRTSESITDIPATLWPIVQHVAAAEGAEVERRVTDHIMGALMTGRLTTTLTDRAGAGLATRRGETLAATRNMTFQQQPEPNGIAADVALLYRLTAALERIPDDIMGAILAGNIAAAVADRTGNPISTRYSATIKAYR